MPYWLSTGINRAEQCLPSVLRAPFLQAYAKKYAMKGAGPGDKVSRE